MLFLTPLQFVNLLCVYIQVCMYVRVCIYVCMYIYYILYDEEFSENLKQKNKEKILKLYNITAVPTFVRTGLYEINMEEE